LLEPQRTNLALYSEQFDNAAWDEIGVSVTANNTTSPDGTANADKLTETATSGNHLFYNLTAISGAATSTISIFYKKGTRRYFAIKLQIGLNSYTHVFDADTATATSNSSNGLTGVTTSIVSYGNGWVRASVTGTDPAASTSCYGIVSLSNAATPTFDPVNYNPNYTGSTSENGYFWGAQLEAGAYATSYIPTPGASSVTRVADTASKTGISSLIGQTEGTIFAEINFDLGVMPPDNSRIQLSDGTTSNWIFIGMPDGASSNLIRIYVNAPSGSMSAYSTNPLVNGVNKIAYGYKSGSFVLYVNGVQAATSSTTLTMATCSRIDLQGDVPTASAKERTKYNQVLLFKTRLTNAQLAELTTL
jgi:hypothetical protein